MFRVAVESIVGFSIDGGHQLVINPSISAGWPRCVVSYRIPGETTRFEIEIENPQGKEHGVSAATLDGQEVIVVGGAARIPLVHDNQQHHVVVRL
jgi:cyclic beta-1,2-glucan synthetase